MSLPSVTHQAAWLRSQQDLNTAAFSIKTLGCRGSDMPEIPLLASHPKTLCCPSDAHVIRLDVDDQLTFLWSALTPDCTQRRQLLPQPGCPAHTRAAHQNSRSGFLAYVHLLPGLLLEQDKRSAITMNSRVKRKRVFLYAAWMKESIHAAHDMNVWGHYLQPRLCLCW